MNSFTFTKLGRTLLLVVAVFAFSVSAKDGYFSVKYLTPLKSPVDWGGVGLEYGWFAGDAVFLGVDGLFGYDDKSGGLDLGAGFSFGYALKLPERLRIITGVSAGFWHSENSSSTGDYGSVNRASSHVNTTDFIGPFIKVQWYFVEIMYRGLLGFYDAGATAGGGSKSEVTVKDDGFDYNQHQFLVGFYF